MDQPQRSKSLLILLLGALTALSPFSIDMYLPAFPKIAADFQSTVAQVSLSLSSYFIGLSAGQLIYGPLLDRFGRKKPLYVGLLIYIVAALGCLTAQGIESLVIFRLLQALGGCAASVATMAMVRDNFTMRESSKVFSLLVLILGVSPLLAPTIGGYVSSAFGWHSVFIILAFIALLLLLASIFLLPKGREADTSVSLRPTQIFKSFVSIFKEPQFYTYSLASSIAFAGIFVYIAGSPIIFMEVFKVEPKVYGWIFALLSVGFIGSSQLNIFLVRRFRNEQIFLGALTAKFMVTVVFFVGAYYNWYDVVGTIILLFLFLSCIGLINPNGAALSLAPFSKNAGSASALMGFLQMGTGALVSVCVGVFDAKGILPIATIMSLASLLALVMLLWGRKRITKPFESSADDTTVVAH